LILQDEAAKEPWFLLASESGAGDKDLESHPGQRCGIETGFLDFKGRRFGMERSPLRISNPVRCDRPLPISALAMALLIVLGATGEAPWS